MNLKPTEEYRTQNKEIKKEKQNSGSSFEAARQRIQTGSIPQKLDFVSPAERLKFEG